MSALTPLVVATEDDPARGEWLRAARDVRVTAPRFVPWSAVSDDWTMDAWRTRLFRHRTRAGFEVWRAPSQVAGDTGEMAAVAEMLAEDGIHAVRSLYRIHVGSHYSDLRFAVLDRKVTHAAGVRADLVILREWYGGRRSEIDAFVTRFGAERWARLVALAERAATFFPGVRSLGRGPHPGRPTGVRPGRRPVRCLPAGACQHPVEQRERVDLRARASAALAISGFVIPVFAAGMLRH